MSREQTDSENSAGPSVDSDHVVATIDALEALYARPGEASLRKQTTFLTPAYKAWITASPFFALASIGPGGMDCSPRGDAAPAAVVVDDSTIHIPDRRGNNRLDTLRNIVEDGRVGLLWLIPGSTECMRVNGTAVLTTDPERCDSYAVDGKAPVSVIVVTVEAAYFQCARAIRRSGLWGHLDENHPTASDVPTAGQMTQQAYPDFDGETYDSELRERQDRTMY